MTGWEGKLDRLARQTGYLADAVRSYQRALLAARQAGASWQQVADAAECSKGAVRNHYRATTEHGGEMHLRLEPLKEGP